MESFIGLFGYSFFQNAFLAAILASISCGIIGTYIVSRRIVFVSGGITHASFGGIGIGYFLGINPVSGALVFSILSAFGVEYLTKKADMRNDSVIAMLWSLGMAIGIIFVYLTPGYSPNLMTYLFGSIVTVGPSDLYPLLALTVFLAVIFIIFHRLILFISFDEQFALTREAPVNLINYFMIGLVALTIVLNIKIAGIILVISLLTIPQNAANLFTNEFRKIIWFSIIIGFAGAFSGLILSYFLNIPSGASIIFSLVVLYLILRILQGLIVYNKRALSN
jgi:zinc transport system permease protein